MLIDSFIEHPQVDKVRFMQNRDGTARAAWYDYHGTAHVEDAWLCERMAELTGGAWAVSKRHAGGNGHEGAELVPVGDL